MKKRTNERPAVLAIDLHCPACGARLTLKKTRDEAECTVHGVYRVKGVIA